MNAFGRIVLRAGLPRHQRGAATVEYVIAALFIAIVLIGNPNVITQLAQAMRDAYASFVYALSASWF
ncbi:MAG TPA: hypothetical protein VL997_03725 [Dyella sp.]|nr:hypothetical protein [Dyella sp.]